MAAYTTFHKDKEGLNNLIGDYEGNYKYQTSINKTCRQAIASSMPTVTLLVSILRLSCDVAIEAEKKEKLKGRDWEFEKDIFPIKTFHMALKLVIWIAQQNK